jgi:hypothetical protein
MVSTKVCLPTHETSPASRECSVAVAAGCMHLSSFQLSFTGCRIGHGGVLGTPPALLLVAPFAYLILSLDGPLVIP